MINTILTLAQLVNDAAELWLDSRKQLLSTGSVELQSMTMIDVVRLVSIRNPGKYMMATRSAATLMLNHSFREAYAWAKTTLEELHHD